MNFSAPLLDGIAVTIFGFALSASFCNILNNRKNRWIFWSSVAVILLLQGLIISVWSDDFLRHIYPLVIHLPLIGLLWVLSKNPLWASFSVFAAYLCCQLRRWLSLLIVTLAGGSPVALYAVQFVLTLPMLLLLLRFVSPSVRHLISASPRQQIQFGVIPALYYAFDYLTVIYTDLLASGLPVVVEFMPFVCAGAYLFFLLYHEEQDRKKFRLQQAQEVLNVQINQSIREIEAVRESQSLIRRHRHDLRHHLQYVSTCIEAGQFEQARSYISGICREIEAQAVQCYCENESANLILSAFVGRAEKDGITMNIRGSLPVVIPVSDRDLCVLLSNALENALHACQELRKDGTDCAIDVHFYEQQGRLYLQITNPCRETVTFEHGVPVTKQPGHGIGAQSICSIVRQYEGICSFLQEDGLFILRVSL